MDLFNSFQEHIAINSFIVIMVVVFVHAIDKTFYKVEKGILNKSRKWSLPLLSLLSGVVFYVLFARMEGTTLSTEHIIFYGLNIGGFSTAFYQIIKEAIVRKINSIGE